MSNFRKLLQNMVSTGREVLSEEKIRNISAKGVEHIKALYEESKSALDAEWDPLCTDSTCIADLIEQNNRQAALLNANFSRFLECKRILVANEYRDQLDTAVQHTCFAYGGIRFYMDILCEYADTLDPQRQDVEQMIVSCYNSSIDTMAKLQQKLEHKCAQIEAESREAVKDLDSSKNLYRALSYTLCTDRLRELHTAIKDGTCTDSSRELTQLQELLDENAKALERALALCDPMPQLAPLKYAPLRTELTALFQPERLESLRSPEGWTPEGYAAGIRSFREELKAKLRQPISLPGEDPAGSDTNI